MKDYNIVITNVSPIRFTDGTDGSEIERKYVDAFGEIYTASMTNEAPIKSIIKRLADKGQILDKVICIASDMVRKKLVHPDYKDLTHNGLLEKKIEHYTLQYNFHKPIFEPIDISDEPDEKEVSKTIFDVTEILSKDRAESGRNVNIYIEANGGVRYVLTMLLSITKTLESYYDNIHIEEITSMVLNREPVQIMNTKSVYDTAQITGIVNEFILYGRINSLQRYMMERIAESSDMDDDAISDIEILLSKLSKISDDIQLCRTSMMLNDFYMNGGIRKDLLAFIAKYESSSISTVYIFRHILKIILEEFDVTIYSEYREEKEIALYLPSVIEWCLNKEFIQQALTFCAERMPKYFIESGKIQLSSHMLQLYESRDPGEYEKEYFFITRMPEFFRQSTNSKINAVISYMQAKENTILSGEEWITTRKDTLFPDIDMSDRMKGIADNLILFCKEYKRNGNKPITVQAMDRILDKYGYQSLDTNTNIKISNNVSTSMSNALRGVYVKDGKQLLHPSLDTLNKRLVKVLPEMIRLRLDTGVTTECYDSILDDLFEKNAVLCNALKNRYSEKQSKKYYILEAIQTGYISSTLPPEQIQRLLYLYSLCKEQRNLSNHAYVSQENVEIAMNSKQLYIVIDTLLGMCN